MLESSPMILLGIQRYKAMFGFVPVTEVVDDPVQKVSVVCILGSTDSA
jgi:hypothetical protein